MPLSRIAAAFAAGFLAVPVFHQVILAALNAGGWMPPGFPAWNLAPLPPFGVPSLISKAFWGGLWAIPIAYILRAASGSRYWLGWAILGAIGPPLVAILVVPPLKGLPIPPFAERMPPYALINAIWGLGTAIFLKLFNRSA
jgi:hypothetical protein